MLQNYTKVFIKGSVLIPVPGAQAPEIINRLSTKKKVKAFLKDLHSESLNVQLEIGTDHSFWALFMALHKGVIAAGGWVKNQEGNLLIIERNGKLDMPKGKLEFHEKIEKCALREVEEECKVKGLKITGEPIKTLHCYSIKGGFALKTTFWYPMYTEHEKKLKPQKEEGITDVYWASPKKLRKKLAKMPSYNSLKEVFDKYVEEEVTA
jgi:8-oxo-dGTP pyrophosphatase MutT (NUDIX family)